LLDKEEEIFYLESCCSIRENETIVS